MPRTKAPRGSKREKKSTKFSETYTVTPAVLSEVNDVRLQYKGRRAAYVSKQDSIIAAIRNAFDMALMALGPTEDFILSWDQEEVNDENVCLSNSPFDNTVSTSVASPEFQSVTNSFVTESVASATGSRPSRSAVRNHPAKTPAPRSNSATTVCATAPRTLRSSSNSRDLGAMPPPSVRNRFCTPASHMVPDGSRYNAITPKVVPNSSVSVLRRPRGGEMAFAMSGSPLMVASSNIGDDICNVNLPLGDGRVLSILPTAFRPRDLPEMSDETMDQLFQLRNNLDMILASEPGTKYH